MMQIKINQNFAGHKEGDIIEIQSHQGIPLENFWRRRLRDSAIDGCCEIVKEKKSRTTKKEVETNEQ
jgi:hypothetical protein